MLVRKLLADNIKKHNGKAPEAIIFKVMQKYTNKQSCYGLGDILRGLVSTYQFCKIHNCKLLVDIHDHPIAGIFNINQKYSTEVSGPVYFYGKDGGPFNTLRLTEDDHIIFCNVFPNALTNDDKEFLQTVITIKDEYKIKTPSSYNVFHIRTGDHMHHRITPSPEFDKYISLFIHLFNPGDVVCSDSNAFKKYIKEKIPDIHILNEDVIGSHIGYETDANILRSAIEDYQLISGASTVYTYSVYDWVSGFVDWCSKIYNIPVINLKTTKVRSAAPKRLLQHTPSPANISTVEKTMGPPSTICVAWTQRVAPPYHTYTWGLGDALRGTIAAVQFCKANNCRFVVDIHRHPFSHFLEWEPTELHTQVDSASIQLRGVGGPAISRPTPGTIAFIYGNAFCNTNLTEDEKEMVRRILRVKPEYRLELPAAYNVVHVRVGDSKMESLSDIRLQQYVKTIAKYAKEGDYLCCDSPTLKRLCKQQLPYVKVVNEDSRSSHFGTDTSLEALRVTLDDMQIIMNAKRIYTYTVYNWISNFVQWISKGYDIPLESIQLEPSPVKRKGFLITRMRGAKR